MNKEKNKKIYDRRHNDIFIPASHYICDALLVDQCKNIIDHDIIQIHLHNEGRLSTKQVSKIIYESDLILKNEKNIIKIETEAYIIGDTHGQFYDLEHLLGNFDLEKDTLLFLGDYVDRGLFSTEIYLYLLVLKIKFKNNLFLLRGNHESEKMTRYYTFKNECLFKYNIDIYLKILKSFNNLPLAAVVLSAVYCAHGGISPSIKKISEINQINRFQEPLYKGPFCDILWSDPHPNYEFNTLNEFNINLQRNCSYYYTYPKVVEFLNNNNLKFIVRGHEVQDQGYNLYKKFNGFPSVVTIFSAPNYCDAYGNKGAYLFYDGDKIHITKFNSVSHPFYLPNFLDGINWSFPFICEKASEFLSDLLKFLSEKESESSSKTSEVDNQLEIAENFTGSMAIMRNERECLNELEDEESSELPCCRLKDSETDINYDEAKKKDELNEKLKKEENLNYEGSSVETSPSCATEISKLLNDVNLKETIKKTEIDLDEKKIFKVAVKPDKNENKKKKPFLFFFQKN
ncbi:catalytic subunit beta [Gurleya vavrai]